MALTAAQLLAISRYGVATVAEQQADGSATAVHPAVTAWYAVALLDESPAAWGVLYDEVIAAKTAHYCIKFPWNADGVARGIVTEEPLNGSPGNRKYVHDYSDKEWWNSTAAGALYNQFKSRIGTKAGPFLCI